MRHADAASKAAPVRSAMQRCSVGRCLGAWCEAAASLHAVASRAASKAGLSFFGTPALPKALGWVLRLWAVGAEGDAALRSSHKLRHEHCVTSTC